MDPAASYSSRHSRPPPRGQGAKRPPSAAESFLRDLNLHTSAEMTCPYLPDRHARHQCFGIDQLHPDVYHQLMDRGYRRSGKIFYANCCESCNECRPIRVPTATFRRSRSQRRVWRRNQDLQVAAGPPVCTRAKWDLFRAYCAHQHEGQMLDTYEEFESFLYESAVTTVELSYLLGDELVGASIVDVSRQSLSSVYFYSSPQHAHRSLGTFSVLWEIELCRCNDLPYYYLGFYVRGARTMQYKDQFRPCEILSRDGRWLPVPSC